MDDGLVVFVIEFDAADPAHANPADLDKGPGFQARGGDKTSIETVVIAIKQVKVAELDGQVGESRQSCEHKQTHGGFNFYISHKTCSGAVSGNITAAKR